jgi:hypothetical protein
MSLELLGNIYFIVGLIALLSFLDYWLTLIAKKYYDKYSSKYLQIETYELNPVFQKSINEGKYNFGHLIGVSILIAIVIFLFYFDRFNFAFEFVVGMIIITRISVINGHVQNIAYCNFINKHPNLIEGKIKREMGLQYYMSVLGSFSLLSILLIIFIFDQSVFLFGGILGTLLSSIKHYRLSQKAINKINKI